MRRIIIKTWRWIKSHLLESSSAIVLTESSIHTVGIISAAVAAVLLGQPWLGLGLGVLAVIEVAPASYLAYKLIVVPRIAARG